MTQVYTRPYPALHEHSLNHREPPAVSDPYAPRSYQRPDPYSPAPSDSSCEGNGWKFLSHPRPEGQAVTAVNMYQTKPENSQPGPAREQLPPLSSLFGAPSHQSRPAQSPFSERQSPIFPSASPLDSRPAPRSVESPYYHKPAHSRPQWSPTSRPDQVERFGFQPPPRHFQPASPRYEHPGPHQMGGWTAQNRPHSDNFSRDTSSSFRAYAESQSHRAQPRSERDSRSVYGDNHAPVYPPTPASVASTEPATTKDGLGPKIWTGTQFLPRFVRQAELPNEGLCYFYDDGTHCKTVIDGEVVNAHWGVTKAGKPRKRLAIACITCREKKIKCDPDYPRCVQCEKFGRVCRFKNAPRGGQGSPGTPPADAEDVPRAGSVRTDAESFRVEKREDSASPRQTPRPASPVSETHHSKRQRTGYSEFTPVASEASPRLSSVQDPTSPATSWIEPSANRIPHSLLRDWQSNPFTSNPALVTELTAVFFKHAPESVCCMFPEGPFKAWLLSSSEKSLDDLMLIYTILTLGTVFSSNTEHKAVGNHYASISRNACESRQMSIQLVQSRLLLALYYFAINNPNDAWDFAGAAFRAASGLKLNIEIEKSEDVHLKVFPYDLNRAGYAECRRRTFWCAYITDRFNGFCSGHQSGIQPDDVFLRLPSDRKSFEAQIDVQNPFFDPTTPTMPQERTVGTMAYLINIVTIWGDVATNIYRTSQRATPLTSNTAFMAFYDRISQRLRDWEDSLPAKYKFSLENLTNAAAAGRPGNFITMHLAYHNTGIKLNRYIQKSILSTPQLTHHSIAARKHAEAILAMADSLTARRNMPSPASPQVGSNLSSVFAGYAILSAIDVLTSRFHIDAIPTLLSSLGGAQTVLSELASFWQTSKNQQALVAQRVAELETLAAASRDTMGGAGAIGFKFGNGDALGREVGDGVFVLANAIEKTYPRTFDCAYE